MFKNLLPESIKKAKKIGIYGGSFDPVHIGHVALLEFVTKHKIFDYTVVVPNYRNPFKKKSYLPVDIRLKILKTVLKDMPRLYLCDFEIQKKRVSYTIDTVLFFKENCPQSNLSLIISQDNYPNFYKWKDSKKILELVNLIIFKRKGYNKLDLKKDKKKINFIDADLPQISSSKIREMKKNESYKWLPEKCIPIWNNLNNIVKN